MVLCCLLFQLWIVTFRHAIQSHLTRKVIWCWRTRHAPCASVKRFEPAPPRRSGGRPKPVEVREAVLRLYDDGFSYRQAMMTFNRLNAHCGMSVSLGTVHDWVQKYHSEWQAVRCATRNRVPRHTPANLRWCIDGTGRADASGIVHFILGIIDHGTRFNLALERLAQPTAEAILNSLFRAMADYGKPRTIRTDNDAVFHSKRFEQALAAAGIRHEFSEPGKPWQNGRIERFFLTLKEKLNLIIPVDGMALDGLLVEFRWWYNEIRPHQHLFGFTPAEVWRGINPYLNAPKDVAPFAGWDGLLKGFHMRR